MPPAAAPLRVATTAMHGVGGALLADLLAAAGHADVHAVAAQERPDPDFPTVPFPNPEEPGATDLLAALMRERGAAIGLALDPDADRVAALVAAPDGGARRLTGDDLGALLGDWLLGEVTAGPGRLVVSSVVSSSLLARVAEAHGAVHAETLTGFKWLSRPALEHPELTQVLAYEEALGYAIGADVRDKDGLTAALATASMAAAEAARGRTLLDALDDLHRRHGAHVVTTSRCGTRRPGATRAGPPWWRGLRPLRRRASGGDGWPRWRRWRPMSCGSSWRAGTASRSAPAAPSPSSSATARPSNPSAPGTRGGPGRRARARLAALRRALAALVAA